MGIIVQRQPANKPGEDIINSVLTTVEAQLAAGTFYVNKNSKDRVIYTGTRYVDDFIQPGEMVTVDVLGVLKNGLISKITGHVSIGDSVDINTQVTIETIK